MLPVSLCKAVLMMLVIVIRSSAAPTEAGDKTARLSYGYPNMQQPLPYGGSNFYGGNNNGIYYNQGAISPFPLVLDASCKKYTCDSKPGMRTGSCDMTCSPDRITPQCPVFNCISASPGTCGNMRCEVSTYSHVLY
ncbi:uncharacterized protein LOC124196441 [Daphnia pulex]|uniref:uncharacterized protein LOC124196441 n=1 Tax=Daphnia pulex TaxID=6669 RepID=UPI001EDCB21F|nr:uncharacterized protein LOC124196441 [Daphnia pulex]